MHATLNMIKTKSTLEVCNFATTKQSPIFIAGVNKLTTNNSNIQEMNSGTPPVSPLQILKTYFGYDSFREGQGEL